MSVKQIKWQFIGIGQLQKKQIQTLSHEWVRIN